ncbi:MAG TPA: hypothetical protein VFY37_08235 [Solirubrobacterales bacterium]|nr:hypothetical protein [Solirubrobacterales bacterium]
MTGADLEAIRAPTGPAFADAVTFAFGDASAQLYGLARIGLSPGEDGEGPRGSALAVLFSGREPVAAIARGGLEVAGGAGWDSIALGGLRMDVTEPLRDWTVAMEGEQQGFELRFQALSPPALIAGDDAVARAGGMEGYEQLCGVTGTVRVGGKAVQVRCLGQRGHGWGEPDWDRIEAARTIAAWPEAGYGLALTSVRPEGAAHAEEPSWAALLDEEGTLPVGEARLSTTYDVDGRQRRAGLELWVGGDEYPLRGSGEVLCGSTLDLGALRLDCAFFRWRIEGETGVGRYDVLRRA